MKERREGLMDWGIGGEREEEWTQDYYRNTSDFIEIDSIEIDN